MIPIGLRRLTPYFVKKSAYDFNILWTKERYLLIELTKKPPKHKELMVYKDIPDYDKEVNPFLL